MALHTAAAEQREGDYYGPGVNRCARRRAVAHGGQVLLSQATADPVRAALPEGGRSGATWGLRDLGSHRLKDLQQPGHLFLPFPQQLVDQPGHGGLTPGMVGLELAHPAVTHPAVLVEEVDRRPVLLSPSVPVRTLRIEKNRVGDTQAPDFPSHIGAVPFPWGLRRVHADEGHLLSGELLLPSAVTRQVVLAIDSAKGPEVKDGDFAPLGRQAEPRPSGRVSPLAADQFRGRRVQSDGVWFIRNGCGRHRRQRRYPTQQHSRPSERRSRSHGGYLPFVSR
jgi:hypothetical protein